MACAIAALSILALGTAALGDPSEKQPTVISQKGKVFHPEDITVERLSIYNQAVLPHHPLSGARLHNTTGKHLLQGPITVLDDDAYGGRHG